MRPGYALYNHRFAPFSARSAATTAAEIVHLIAGRTSALVAAIFFALVLVAQAQESVEEAALPAWSEPTLPSSEPAPSMEAAPLPSAPESAAFYTSRAVALFVCTVAFFRGGVSIFVRPVVFFGKLHHSTDECDWITRRGSALRWVQHEEHRGR